MPFVLRRARSSRGECARHDRRPVRPTNVSVGRAERDLLRSRELANEVAHARFAPASRLRAGRHWPGRTAFTHRPGELIEPRCRRRWNDRNSNERAGEGGEVALGLPFAALSGNRRATRGSSSAQAAIAAKGLNRAHGRTLRASRQSVSVVLERANVRRCVSVVTPTVKLRIVRRRAVY